MDWDRRHVADANPFRRYLCGKLERWRWSSGVRMSELWYGGHRVLMNLAVEGQERGPLEGRRKFYSGHRSSPWVCGWFATSNGMYEFRITNEEPRHVTPIIVRSDPRTNICGTMKINIVEEMAPGTLIFLFTYNFNLFIY